MRGTSEPAVLKQTGKASLGGGISVMLGGSGEQA